MRSGDGNRTSTFSIFKIILLLYSFALCADEYLISYRYVVEDATLYNEKLDISKAMHKCQGTPSSAIFLEHNEKKDLKEIIMMNQEEFISFVHQLGIDVQHTSINTHYSNHSTIIMTLKTTCFKVDFNDSFARISSLKKG